MFPFPRARRMPGLEVEVGRLERDRLRRAQAAGVHELEQRAVAQRGGLGARGLVEQARDLVAGQDVRQAPALLRARAAAPSGRRRGCRCGAGGGRRSAGRRSCAGASRARRAGGRPGPVASSAVNVGQLGVADRERVVARALQPGAVLEQVGAVGLEGVARQARARTRGRRGSRAGGARRAARGWMARRWPLRRFRAGGRAHLPGATRGAQRRGSARGAQAVAQEEQPDQRLRVAARRRSRSSSSDSGWISMSIRSPAISWPGSSRRPVARKTWHCSFVKPGVV